MASDFEVRTKLHDFFMQSHDRRMAEIGKLQREAYRSWWPFGGAWRKLQRAHDDAQVMHEIWREALNHFKAGS